MAHTRLVLAALLGLTVADTALAQGVGDLLYGERTGPQVYEADPDTSRFAGPPMSTDGRDLRAIGAVPVPTVMNGGSFGITGNDYYNDMKVLTPQGPRRNSETYMLAPAYRSPPLR
ncbi:hypothetical protein ASG52_06880 [Methylobacterium sp. Leaf456]|uniref:hypothetical protein n=1 Tax=Methylobacterium sp. Leaf456 TaxID=1736382 RepID=UPI0006F37033|nr:hypothetical protein [Methylobacterium sp. Leaf456]KQT50532.1 hypothetical protein ASG52_06880 [Methylobacterium sp. Leaf456]